MYRIGEPRFCDTHTTVSPARTDEVAGGSAVEGEVAVGSGEAGTADVVDAPVGDFKRLQRFPLCRYFPDFAVNP